MSPVPYPGAPRDSGFGPSESGTPSRPDHLVRTRPHVSFGPRPRVSFEPPVRATGTRKPTTGGPDSILRPPVPPSSPARYPGLSDWCGVTPNAIGHPRLNTFVLPHSGHCVIRPSGGCSSEIHSSLPSGAVNPHLSQTARGRARGSPAMPRGSTRRDKVLPVARPERSRRPTLSRYAAGPRPASASDGRDR